MKVKPFSSLLTPGLILAASLAQAQLTIEYAGTASAGAYNVDVPDSNGNHYYPGFGAHASAPTDGPGGSASQTATITYAANLVWNGADYPTSVPIAYTVHSQVAAYASLAPATSQYPSGMASAQGQMRNLSIPAGPLSRGSDEVVDPETPDVQDVDRLFTPHPAWQYSEETQQAVATVTFETVTASASASYASGRSNGGDSSIPDDNAYAFGAESFSNLRWAH